VSRLNQKIYRHIEAWRNRKIEGEFPYLFLDGVVLKRSWAGEVRNVSVLVAIGVVADGHRQILGVAEGQKEDLEGWRGFLRYLKDRSLVGVQLIISDACLGLVEAAAELFPDAPTLRACSIRRRTRVVGAFPDGHSTLILVAARLRHIASTKWSKRRYLAMETLLNPLPEEAAA
jgi:putative transposase